jgi:hypothetical protein
MANENNWDRGMDSYSRAFWYEEDEDFIDLKDWFKLKREELGKSITAWWDSFDHDFTYNNFEECLEEVLYCYVEKELFR